MDNYSPIRVIHQDLEDQHIYPCELFLRTESELNHQSPFDLTMVKSKGD